MTAVAVQPRICNVRPMTNRPMMCLRVAMSMMIAMTGAATTPLTTALRNSARMGSTGSKLSSTPPTVAAAMVP